MPGSRGHGVEVSRDQGRAFEIMACALDPATP